ncbi:DUF5615 family PIN-like protein, partial [Candidatus Calescamantes bacterium]|nr:DUF5615 family PIN-like protein [Candidatus Calescamantes bacterium]
LKENGYDATHIREYGMQNSSDEEILELATRERRILISADTDLGRIEEEPENLKKVVYLQET